MKWKKSETPFICFEPAVENSPRNGIHPICKPASASCSTIVFPIASRIEELVWRRFALWVSPPYTHLRFGTLDIQNLNAARKYARSLYEQNRHETDPEKIKEMIYNAEASAAWVEKCLVQVVSTEKGTYRVNLKSTHNYTPEFNMEESFFDFGKKGKCK